MEAADVIENPFACYHLKNWIKGPLYDFILPFDRNPNDNISSAYSKIVILFYWLFYYSRILSDYSYYLIYYSVYSWLLRIRCFYSCDIFYNKSIKLFSIV